MPRIPLALATALVLVSAAAPSAAAESRRGAALDDLPATATRAMTFRLVGPFRGGRVTAVAGVPSQPGTFYMGATGGGVWKTTDGGTTWRNVSDKVRRVDPEEPPQPMTGPPEEGAPRVPERSRGQEAPEETRVRPGDAFGSASIGAIAVAPSDPNVIWVGTGSACIRGNVSPGDGVYRSTDGGDSWRHLGLPEAGQIGRLHVHPDDPDTAWVAVLGNAFGPSATRGVYRTRDGGASWQRVLWVSDRAGAVDLAIDATNPRILYAATWEAVRQPWTMVSGGEGSGLYKSTDGGDTWRKLSEGLPEGTLGRIGVAVSPARPSRVWALVEHAEEGGLYRSEDGGRSFRRVSSDRTLLQRSWYYTHVHADPQDADTVYVLNVPMLRSVDGGATFTAVRTPHVDNHDLWIHPDDPQIMVEGNDGGANVTTNGGRTWSTQANQPTAEMYRVTVDDQWPYWLYGGQQDNSAIAIPSMAPGGIARQDWYTPGGCESATVAIDPRDPAITYAGCYGGTIGRYDKRLSQEQEVMAWPEMAVGKPASDLRFRFQWNAPIKASRHRPGVIYHTSNVVHRSHDEGRSWEILSPDLTHDDPERQRSSGGPITQDNTGVEVFGTVFAFEESPHAAGELWAGSDDGRVHISRDDGATWQEVTPRAMPQWGTVNNIEVSTHAPGRVFLAVHRYRLADFRPYVFRTDDWGASWRLLTDGRNGIPADHFVRAVREDPDRRGLLYAGTEFGLYASFDDGASWQPFQLDLPVTPITDLAVHRQDLVVATQGRSYWILDDLTPLHQMSDAVLAAEAHLFAPRPALRWQGMGGGWGGDGPNGRNPPLGAVIWYHLGDDLSAEGATEVTLEILDGEGAVLRRLSSQQEEPAAPNPWAQYFPDLVQPRKLEAKAGLNRYVWNLRRQDAYVVDDAILWGSPVGPEVPPGDYRLRLTVGDWSATQGLVVRADPRNADVPREAMDERYALARSIWESISELHRALAQSRGVRTQARDLLARLPEADRERAEPAAERLATRLQEVEDALHQSRARAGQDVLNFTPGLDNQLLFLFGVVESALGSPTGSASERYAELRQQLDGQLARFRQVLAEDLPAFNREVGTALPAGPVTVPVITDETAGTAPGRGR